MEIISSTKIFTSLLSAVDIYFLSLTSREMYALNHSQVLIAFKRSFDRLLGFESPIISPSLYFGSIILQALFNEKHSLDNYNVVTNLVNRHDGHEIKIDQKPVFLKSWLRRKRLMYTEVKNIDQFVANLELSFMQCTFDGNKLVIHDIQNTLKKKGEVNCKTFMDFIPFLNQVYTKFDEEERCLLVQNKLDCGWIILKNASKHLSGNEKLAIMRTALSIRKYQANGFSVDLPIWIAILAVKIH